MTEAEAKFSVALGVYGETVRKYAGPSATPDDYNAMVHAHEQLWTAAQELAYSQKG